MDKSKIYYVYVAYLDEIPRYVGFGKGSRYLHVNSGASTIRKLNEIVIGEKRYFDVIIESKDLCKSQAIKIEKHFIAKFGLEINSTGTLWNYNYGGTGPMYHTKEHLVKIQTASKALWQRLDDKIRKVRIARLLSVGKSTRFKKGIGGPGGISPKRWLIIRPGEPNIEIVNLSLWCRENGLSRNTISRIGSKKYPTKEGKYKGWQIIQQK